MYSKENCISNSTISEDIYKFYVIPNSSGKFDLKILHMTFDEIGEAYKDPQLMTPTGFEILDPTNQLIAKSSAHFTQPFVDLDPYFRMKLKGSPLYNFLYDKKEADNFSIYSLSSYRDRNVFSEKEICTINLINLSSKDLNYLYHLSMDMDPSNKKLFMTMIAQTIFPLTTKNRNSRKRLGISKNKEIALQKLKYPFLMKYDNEIFDDDIDLLVRCLAHVSDNLHKSAVELVFRVKKMNKNIKIQHILRKVCKLYMDSDHEISFSKAFNSIHNQTIAYKALIDGGLDANKYRFKLNNYEERGFFDSDKNLNPPEQIPFVIDGYDIGRILTTHTLLYINSMTQSYPYLYFKNGIESGSIFYFGVNKKSFILIEYRNGIVCSVKRNMRDVLVKVHYVVQEKKEGEENGA